MQLNQPEYMKEKPFSRNVSMEEQGDKHLLLFLCPGSIYKHCSHIGWAVYCKSSNPPSYIQKYKYVVWVPVV